MSNHEKESRMNTGKLPYLGFQGFSLLGFWIHASVVRREKVVVVVVVVFPGNVVYLDLHELYLETSVVLASGAA